jgi:hypothetical protein
MARTERFPKNLRYSLAQKIDNICLEILELIVQTIYSQSKREPLQNINLKLDVLRSLIQMAFKMQRLSESQYEYISRDCWRVVKWWEGGSKVPKRIGYLYDRLTSWSNLYLSYKKACKHKKSKAETTEWMFNCEKYLFELQTELIEQRYHPQPYKYFVIREPKERVISVAAFRDRVVHHALVNIIEPYFEAIFIKDSYATRKDKGLHLAVQAAQVYARHYGWYLKLDIQKFFASVNHEILLSLINRKIKDPEVMALCRIILGNQTLSMGLEENRGLPVGNLTLTVLCQHLSE